MSNKKSKGSSFSTFDREMQDAKFKADFDKEYRELVLQELLLAMSDGDEKSVRTLAKAAGLHPNAIQNLRSGKTTDIKLTSFLKIARAHGFEVELVKGDTHIRVSSRLRRSRVA